MRHDTYTGVLMCNTSCGEKHPSSPPPSCSSRGGFGFFSLARSGDRESWMVERASGTTRIPLFRRVGRVPHCRAGGAVEALLAPCGRVCVSHHALLLPLEPGRREVPGVRAETLFTDLLEMFPANFRFTQLSDVRLIASGTLVELSASSFTSRQKLLPDGANAISWEKTRYREPVILLVRPRSRRYKLQ